ncbi:MAG TPA: hypothetical protein VM778_10235 [Gemmatimonadota bacterium]|nr:hypothetical protein [Gemmatimonadota bacterium]
MIHSTLRRLALALVFAIPFVVAACSGSGPVDPDPCPGCPPPPVDGAIRLTIEYDDAARGGLQPAGFSLADLERVELTVSGGGQSQHLSLPPNQTAAFMTLPPGSYNITASAFGENSLLLFFDDAQVTVVLGETVDVTLVMDDALGTVSIEIDARTTGPVNATAGEDLPLKITVRNIEGSLVPGAVVRVRPAVADYGNVSLTATDRTGLDGAVHGVIRAPFSGQMDLLVDVDNRPVPNPVGPTHIDFATGVSAANSRIILIEETERPAPSHPLANGSDTYTFTLQISNDGGEPLAGVPVRAVSSRNAGVVVNVDIIEPRVGFESWTTDVNGQLIFTIRSTTSSFLRLDEQGLLTSVNSGGAFTPSSVEVFADEVLFDQRNTLIFNSVVDPNRIEFTPSSTFVNAGGNDFAVIEVDAAALGMFGGGPASNVLVEIVKNIAGQPLDGVTLVPEPGFGFRTNGNGIWRGRLSRDQPQAVHFYVKVDGRAVNPFSPKLVIFQ